MHRYNHIAGTVGIQPAQVFGGNSCPWYSNRDAAAANPGSRRQGAFTPMCLNVRFWSHIFWSHQLTEMVKMPNKKEVSFGV